ncbi:MAG: hypothetical protein IJ912_12045 [Fibrobacter sp.]|nr:hypothetical protein [Fibrobacter sp.]
MINSHISLTCVLFSAALFSACFDNGSSASNESDTFDASIVCPTVGMNAYGEPNRGTFTDVRDGQVYKYTTIGNQVWMAENLKFDAPYSVCYDKIDGFCDTFGRFYSLHENGKEFGLFDQELLDTICPAGWHVPSVNEWSVLANNMGEEAKAVSRLRSSENFGEKYKPGTDDCGFNSLPAGYWINGGDISVVYITSDYWTSTAKNLGATFSSWFSSNGISFEVNQPKMSIRCIRN